MGARSLLVAVITLTTVSAALWGAVIADIWAEMPRDLMAFARVAAVTASISALACWLSRRRERSDALAELYIQVIADVTRPARSDPGTGPLPLHLVR